MTERRQLDVITGPASTEPCCLPGLCAYRPEMVAAYLGLIAALEAAGEDPGEAAASALSNKEGGRPPASGGGSGLAHISERIWDIQGALRELGVSARSADPAAVGGRLCPWSGADS